MRLAFRVYGTPAPQGSKRHVGRGVMVESSKRVQPWRADVVNAARQAIEATGDDWTPIAGPVSVAVSFRFARPKSHYGSGRNAGVLKASAPFYVTSRAAGDVDKLVRSSLDALVAAGVLVDDSLVAELGATTTYSVDGDAPGAYIEIEELA